MSSGRTAEESSAAYVLPSVAVDIRRTHPPCVATQNTQRCSRVRRPRSALRSNWVDGGDALCLCEGARRNRIQTAVRTFPIHCLAGNGSGPDESPDDGPVKTEERAGKGESWFSGLKVWFKGKGGDEERNLLSEKGAREERNESEINGRVNATDTLPSNQSSDEPASEKTDSFRDSFRWPWQKNSNSTTLMKEKEGNDDESGKEGSNVRRRKKVTHTDSKPGGSFTASGEGKSGKVAEKPEKGKSGWQDTWDKVIEVIAPNLPNFDDWKKKDTEATVRDKDVSSKVTNNGTHGTLADSDSSTVPQPSSVHELYSPPSENSVESKSEQSPRQQQGPRWPKFPWVRGEEQPKDDRKAPEVAKGEMKRSSGPRISTVETVTCSEDESTESAAIIRSPSSRDEEEQRRDPSSILQDPSQSTAVDEDNADPQTASVQKESQREKEPALQLPAVRSQLKVSHVDMVSIPQRDVAAIRLIFGSETFFATETLSPPGGLIFRGNLRGEPKATVAKLEERLATRLGDKYTLCLAEGEEDLRPVVVIVPTARDKRPATPRQRFFALVIGLITISTCLARGLYSAAFKPMIESFYPVTGASMFEKFFSIQSAVSFTMAASIGIIIVISQIVQRVVASRYGTRIALPYFIPSFQLGSFGAVVQLASPTPTREALFDIALSGAATLVFASLSLLLVGLRLSTTFSGVVPVPISTVSSSVLIGFLTQKVPHGNILVDYGRSLIALHPLAVVGANCLTIAALNLLPMRQLDGGRIISALYGRRTAVFASRVTVMFLLLASTKSPYFVVFLAAVTFGPWNVDRPSKNELTEPDGVRTIVGYLFMLLMIGVLLPYPASKFFGTL